MSRLSPPEVGKFNPTPHRYPASGGIGAHKCAPYIDCERSLQDDREGGTIWDGMISQGHVGWCFSATVLSSMAPSQ